jgi:nucleoside-diphosphate-sugar epimerase
MAKTKRTIQGNNVCVIGGAGFLGSHLVNHLIEDRDCNVLVVDNLVSGKKEFIHKKAKFFHHDITNSEAQLRKIFEDYNIEYVFNYAAEPYIPVSFERPLHVFDINARGALMVMNAAQDAGVQGILQVSSAEIYGNVDGKIKETDQSIPHSTYGVAKLAIDHLISARWKENKTPAIAMRQFNCYGERETHEYIIPVIIDQIDKAHGQIATINLGNNSFRDFQYAGDAVKMAVNLLECGDFGEVYNMGSETGILMYDLAETIGSLMEKDVVVVPDESRMRPWEIWHLQSDNTKLYETIDVRPEVSFEEGLIRTINNYKEHGWVYKD